MSNENRSTNPVGEKMMKLTSNGAGIMVSDFVDEHNGFLSLSDAKYDQVKATNAHFRRHTHQFLEYGESREGYWPCDRFIQQMKIAFNISEIKYPKEEGWSYVKIFDHR